MNIVLRQKDIDMYGLSISDFKLLQKLNTPQKIQNFLDTIPVNWENGGDTYMSVTRTLKAGKAHCIEGALLAALALWIQGEKPLIMDLKSSSGDDHIVTLYTINGRWGAISKTNHATLRFRDPVYKTVRELALSYFHEYIDLKTAEKILVSYSDPFDLRKVIRPKRNTIESIKDWVSGEDELDWLAESIDTFSHKEIYPKENKKHLRRADSMEVRAGTILEWKKTDLGV
jgi:hypothetical protein